MLAKGRRNPTDQVRMTARLVCKRIKYSERCRRQAYAKPNERSAFCLDQRHCGLKKHLEITFAADLCLQSNPQSDGHHSSPFPSTHHEAPND